MLAITGGGTGQFERSLLALPIRRWHRSLGLRCLWAGLLLPLRGVVLFLALFAIANVAHAVLRSETTTGRWWLDLRPLPDVLSHVWELAAGIALLASVRPPHSVRLRTMATAILLATLVVAMRNAGQFHDLVTTGRVLSVSPLSVSAIVASALAGAGVLFWIPGRDSRFANRWLPILLLPVVACLFAWLQIVTFGQTDYRRPTDAAVVFGCRVYRDGRPSHALTDRMLTAVELYRAGLVQELWLSGGPGNGDTHETKAMLQFATGHGVPAAAIRVDPAGLDTASTVRNTSRWSRSATEPLKLLAVSHGYHLPRIKLCYQRSGVEVCTVPARERHRLPNMVWLQAREIAAFWWYFCFV